MKLLKNYVTVIAVTYLVLFLIGIFAMWSIDLAKEQVFQEDSNFVQKYVITLLVGLVVFAITTKVPFKFYKDYLWFLYWFGIALLISVYAFPPINGSHRWIRLGGFTLQPTELAKIIVILFLSMYIEKNEKEIESFVKGLLLPGIFSLPYIVLILFQPDLSSSMLLGFLVLLTLYYGGIKKRYFFGIIALGIIAVVIASSLGILHDYQLGRLKYFFEGKLAPQVEMAVKPLRNAGITGSGPSGNMLKVYVPEVESDFVLSALGEDLGVFGIYIAVFMYILQSFSLIRIASFIKQTSLKIFISSYASMILLHVTINLGVFSGVFPVTGIPLPFISSGGSVILAILIGFGILLSGLLENEEEKKESGEQV